MSCVLKCLNQMAYFQASLTLGVFMSPMSHMVHGNEETDH
jgi:hypothetical protein